MSELSYVLFFLRCQNHSGFISFWSRKLEGPSASADRAQPSSAKACAGWGPFYGLSLSGRDMGPKVCVVHPGFLGHIRVVDCGRDLLLEDKSRFWPKHHRVPLDLLRCRKSRRSIRSMIFMGPWSTRDFMLETQFAERVAFFSTCFC